MHSNLLRPLIRMKFAAAGMINFLTFVRKAAILMQHFIKDAMSFISIPVKKILY